MISLKSLLAVGVLAVLAAVTATSAHSGTSASFTLTAGVLSISAPTGPVSLGTQVVSSGTSTISGQLGVVTVTDQRGGATAWVASVIVTAFTPTTGPAVTAIPATQVSYSADTDHPTRRDDGPARDDRPHRRLAGCERHEHRAQHRVLEPDHLGDLAAERRAWCVLGNDHPFRRLSECAVARSWRSPFLSSGSPSRLFPQ